MIAILSSRDRPECDTVPPTTESIPADYSSRIRELRGRFVLTQSQLAERLGVSFATVNRWENGQTRPSPLAWSQILSLGEDDSHARDQREPRNDDEPVLDFTGRVESVRAVSEAQRLSYGHAANPSFATELALIEPLPHQRLAVYDRMLGQSRLRFLLADDAGAGKTIMAGLYIREMISRRLIRRVLVVPPAGLVGNWQRELETLFGLRFTVVEGSDGRQANPFIESDRVVVSVDTLRQPRMFSRLREIDVEPYDLVIFDEAHKLAANRYGDLRVEKTDRYKLAEALAGVPDASEGWRLPWSATHLLLLTATPHMGRDYPYYALWRLLDPAVLSTPEAFDDYPREKRQKHFIRRTKEEMVYIDGRALYPTRVSDTLGYELTQGDGGEQELYDATTEYLKFIYNKAKLLNRSAARLAMSVFQRRLASSTYALARSFERRIEKLANIIDDVQAGRITIEQLTTLQRRMTEDDDVFESKGADEESASGATEENEASEDRMLQGLIAVSLADLLAEREQVEQLRDLARRVLDTGIESKFERLREALTESSIDGEKVIIFTEHRDTLDYLVRRFEGLGLTGQIAQIHGGMHYRERESEVERFRLPQDQGGARILVCTDAAGEGINLQFCWAMINYDIPWNPARLEQRMGRIHRFGQKHDPVIVLNLVAPETREGRVLKTLLDKLEEIRKRLGSDKVFDCIGRVYANVSIKEYMQRIVDGADANAIALELGGRLSEEQIAALEAREAGLYGEGGEVARELPRVRQELSNEDYRKLVPGYVRQFIELATPLLDLRVEGELDGRFALRPSKPRAADPLQGTLEEFPTELHDKLTVVRPSAKGEGIWVHPGEKVFDRLHALLVDRVGDEALRGGVFVDPDEDRPYLFHVAAASVMRRADREFEELARPETIECRLVGVKQYSATDIRQCPVEHLLLLRGGAGLPAAGQRLAADAADLTDQAEAFLLERVARTLAVERRETIQAAIPERTLDLTRGFNYRAADLAAARARQSEKARKGDKRAHTELDRIKALQRDLAAQRDRAIAMLRHEPDLIAAGDIRFFAHALVVPSSDPIDRERHETNVEKAAMEIAWAWEESEGAVVKDVHTPELARAAGLQDYPGFDLLSFRPDGERRAIEVKGRARTGDVELFANEWARALNMGKSYWLYVVYDCATPNPRLARVQDPFNALVAKVKGSVLISPRQVAEVSG